MNDSFQQIMIHPSLPCVYHNCDGRAKIAIVYQVSEREWRMVPTCDRHTVSIQASSDRSNDAAPRG